MWESEGSIIKETPGESEMIVVSGEVRQIVRITIQPNDVQKIGLKHPTRISINITRQCNLRCPHCLSSSGLPDKDELTTKELFNLIDQLKENGKPTLAIGGGEPLIREDIFEVLSYAKKQGVPASLVTNSLLFTQAKAQKLNSLNLVSITVSIDGLEKNHDFMRGKGNFKRTIKNIRLLRKYIHTAKLAMRVTVNTRNVKECGKLIKLAESLELDNIRLTPALPIGRAKEHLDLLISQEQYLEFLRKCHKIKTKIDVVLPDKNPNLSSIREGEFGCHCGRETCWITQTGDVYPCIFFGDVFLAGNIRKKKFSVLWEKSKEMVRFGGNGLCNTCLNYKNCRGGCRARALWIYNDINAVDPYCPLEKNRKQFYDDIKGVHLELTTKCNSSCAMCGRNVFGRVRPNLRLAELALQNCKEIFPPELLRQLENMSMCGVYGEPTIAKDFLEIVDYFLVCNPKLNLDIYTNGGLYQEKWWEKLALIIGNRNGKVVFGIDGLEDTHSIHRRGTDFETIIRNAKAFIGAGGIAEWDFIVFKHNEHQVGEARKLSENIGFKSFQIKRTSRFYNYFYEKDTALVGLDEQFGKKPLYNSKKEKIGYIELPVNPYYQNDSLQTIKELAEKYGSLVKYFDETQIDCQAKRTKGIFVSAEGFVFPCCWAYQQSNYGTLYGVKDPLELNEAEILRKSGGIEQLSAKKHPIKEIVNSEFFKGIERSWDIRGLKNGKSKVCARHCGCQLDMHRKQHDK